ncbi:MAG: two-component system, cell cycle sensor histidine kinase and response regulator CckA [Actinomycetota bacterium]|nr:two-component system, cell cycle sensor histidine kinase and response regulator CckA [Actinomycetota bacterium]
MSEHRSPLFASDRAWLVVILGGSAAVVGYFLIPNDVLRSSLFPLVGLSCGTIILTAATRIVPGRSAWRCFGIALLLWGVGDAIWALYGLSGRVAPYPSWADVAYLLGYPALIAGIVVYVTSRRRGSLWRSVMDVALISIPVTLIAWDVVNPWVTRVGISSADIVGLSYPFLDLVLFGVAFTLIFSPRPRMDTRLLGVAIALLLLADFLYAVDIVAGTYHTGIWYDGAWLVSFVLWAAAALHPSAHRAPEKVPEGADDDTHSILAFTAVSALVAILSYDAFRGRMSGPEFLLAGGSTIFLAVARMQLEVRHLRHSQARVREGAELLQHAFEAGASGMTLGTLDGKFIRVNRAFAGMLGYEPEELVGIATAAVTHPDDRESMVEPFARMARGDLAEFHTAKRYLHRDGHDISVRLDLALSRDAERRPRLLVGHILDVSHSKELEARLRQAARMEAVGQLAGGVAHDFNNILAVILNYAEFVDESLDEGHAGHSDLTQITRAGERGAELVRQLLAFSRQEVIELAAVDLSEVVNGMAVLLERSCGEDISLTLESSAELSLTMADHGQVEQILLNLVNNARDSMPRGGKITIATRDVVLETGTRAGLPGGHYVCLTVTDTGTGIDAQTHERIFEPFFTTKPRSEGTGLGLATVYGIVKRVQGGIYADSELGVGTTFVVYFPMTDEQMPAPVEFTPIEATNHAATILVVEDEDPVRELIGRILRRDGFDVIDVDSGAKAVEICSAHEGDIDLLLTDVVMPGMSGPQLRDLVHVIRPEMRVLFISGYTDELIARRGVLEKGESLLSKPFNSQQLLTRVRESLNAPQRAAV